MGGKHKQAQRVKNNARPSSSARSAERLGGVVSTPFASVFSASQKNEDASTSTDEIASHTGLDLALDSSLDPQFQLVFKKMNKKDGTTKLKALNEFRQLIEASEAEAVGLVAGLWCRIYVGLLSCEEGRVREVAHRAHEVVCKRAVRSLAPHMRLVAAPWLAAQHDSYAPAAHAASSSLDAAFLDERRRTELSTRCRRQLLRQAANALFAQQQDGGRAACGALLAAAAALARGAPPDDECATALGAMLLDERFWSAAGTPGRIQIACITLLAAACRDECRTRVTLDGRRALHHCLAQLAVTGNISLGPEAADVAAPLWDCVLLLLPLHCADELHDADTQLVRPLMGALHDSPARFCPIVLPLLARLPPGAARSAACVQLLATLQAVLREPRVQHSCVELSAAAAAYMDVAQWCDDVHAPADCVRAALCDAAPHSYLAPLRALLDELARLLRRWRDERIWAHLANLFDDEQLSPRRLPDMLAALARPPSHPVRLPRRVTFEDGDTETLPERRNVETSTQGVVEPDDPWYEEQVTRLAGYAVDAWLHRCSDPIVVAALLVLLRVPVCSVALLDSGNAARFYDELLLPSLHDVKHHHTPDHLAQLVLLAFMLVDAMKEAHRRVALDALPIVALPDAVCLALRTAQSHSSNRELRAWLCESPHVHDLYVTVAHNCVKSAETESPELLVRALRADPPLLGNNCAAKVADILRAGLEGGTRGAALYEAAAAACQPHLSTASLALAPCLLAAVSCDERARELAGDQVVRDVERAWCDAFAAQSDLLTPLVEALHSKCPRDGQDSEARITCAASLALACRDPLYVLGSNALSSHAVNVRDLLEQLVAAAQHATGRDVLCQPAEITRWPTREQWCEWLGWWRLAAGALLRLFEPLISPASGDTTALDTDEFGSSQTELSALVLRSYALTACYSRHYYGRSSAHPSSVTDLLRLDEARRVCVRVARLYPPSELQEAWWASAPTTTSPELAVVTWAACAAFLVSEDLLPATALGPRSPHVAHVARASAAHGLLNPLHVPPLRNPLDASRLAVLSTATVDGTSETAIAEAKHALRAVVAQTSRYNCIDVADACLLLEVVIAQQCASPDLQLLELATVRLAAWAAFVTKECAVVPQDVRFVVAYTRLAAIHSARLKMATELRREYEELFAGVVRRALAAVYWAAIESACVDDPRAWPLCSALTTTAMLIVPDDDVAVSTEATWRASMRALSDAGTCPPAQLLAHRCLARLCEALAARELESGRDNDDGTEASRRTSSQPPPWLAGELVCAQDEPTIDGRLTLGRALLWHATAALHATVWEKERAHRVLDELLAAVPVDARDDWFEDEDDQEEGTDADQVDVGRWACRAFTRWLTEAGATARVWYVDGGSDERDRQRAERLAARHVTRRAVRAQLRHARLPTGVRCSAAASRLVRAECSVEDARIELQLELGEAWPLGRWAPRVECRPAPRRDRLMQLTLAAAAGAPVPHLVALWKDAVDRRFEGVDECHICFSLLHAATAQLPRLRCPTCRKCFHSHCLYRWFSTSNKSTCPICRNLF